LLLYLQPLGQFLQPAKAHFLSFDALSVDTHVLVSIHASTEALLVARAEAAAGAGDAHLEALVPHSLQAASQDWSFSAGVG
jgi:hypothetical protein